uniref:hypothetical protein n=1 Tax=Okeania sp. SIO2F4 TaxID=2607790 RepID=UPI0025EC68B8|nr:hypothetical protein [Okeania sp. SIO2F4]
MTVQDDPRENELIQLFNLERPVNLTRSRTDAILILNELKIPFELKSTTKTYVTTVRDFRQEHIKKWRGKHWLFRFYEKGGKILKYCLYASRKMMAPWISEKSAYVALDYKLAQLIPELISISLLYEIVCWGKRSLYT